MLSTVSTIVVDPPEGHLKSYLDSLERLLREPMGTLHPAHGPAARDGHRLVRQYLRHRAQRETALVQALQKGPATIDELVPIIYWEIDRAMFWIAARSLLAGAEKLGEEGRARLRADGRWELAPKSD
jgi:glyoxylase-like metal-dependent hydrolase (beta-lactamase superfamily II)